VCAPLLSKEDGGGTFANCLGATKMLRHCAFAFAVISVIGCGRPVVDTITHQFNLDEEPSGAIGVIELRENAQDGESVVVVGSVGGGINPWVKGRAAFVLVDACASMECSGACCDEGCNCKASELTDSIVVVKFVGQDGKVIARDARDLLGLQLLDTVVVHGKAKRDKAGNVAMVADGLYIRR
jgi:hypothetical protein